MQLTYNWKSFKIHLPSLVDYVKNESDVEYDGMIADEIQFTFIFKNELNIEQQQNISDYLDDLTESSEALKFQPTTESIVKAKIQAAMAFGQELILEFATNNVMSGLSVSQIDYLSQKLFAIQSLLYSGSLYTALDRIEALEPDATLTQPIIDQFAQKIRTYLGI